VDGQNFVHNIIGSLAHQVNIEGTEQVFRGVQHGRRIVIATRDDDVFAVGGFHVVQKPIVHRSGIIGRSGDIEDITGNEQDVSLLLLDGMY